jgi:DNA-binding CsgD family transcriptional regulator
MDAMNPFLEMWQRIHSSPCYDQARRFAAPLYDHFGINHFWYYRISLSGAYTYMGTHAEWSAYCFEKSLTKHFPCLRHPNVLGNGVHLMRAQPSDNQYKEVRQIAWDKFRINFNLNLFEKRTEGVEAFGFGTCFDDPRSEERLINELPLLRYFVKVFRKKQEKLFRLLEDNQIDLLSQTQEVFYERPKEIVLPFDRESFLRTLGCQSILSLTPREKEILKLLASGFPSSYIKEELHLGIRTVENYIATIKDKLACSSKVELIHKAQEIASTGWLSIAPLAKYTQKT